MRGWLVGLVAVVLAVVAAAIVLIVVVAGSDTTAVVDLDVGDCFDLPSDDGGDVVEFETVELVPCDEPHEVEVVLVGELNPDGEAEYPDDDELFVLVGRRCDAGVELPEEIASRFGVVPIAPTQDTWEGADGRFSCIVLQYGGDPVDFSVLAADPGASSAD